MILGAYLELFFIIIFNRFLFVFLDFILYFYSVIIRVLFVLLFLPSELKI